MNTRLILDVSYLCHRAFHTTGLLSYQGVGTGVVYGFLRDVINLQWELEADRLAFCFDTGPGLREKASVAYKANRRPKEADPEQDAVRTELRKQVEALRDEYLPELGYKNIFLAKGYEADDVIASVCLNLPADEQAVIVSSDHDLYQLLNDHVSMYDPHRKKRTTPATFREEFGIPVTEWVEVKAWAGCHGDGVAGVKGIGELTACKYLRGDLKETSKKYKAITANQEIHDRNLPLVKLPYPGTPVFELKSDEVTKTRWLELTRRLGMRSLAGKFV